MELIKNLVLRLFNRVYGCNLGLVDVGVIRELFSDTTRITQDDVSSLKVVFGENLKISSEDAVFIRFMSLHGLRLTKEYVSTFRMLSDGDLLFEKDSGGTCWLIVGQGRRFRLDDLFDLGKSAQLCYSQEGESLIIDRLFDFRDNGTYVDVGAHHPKRFSNTYDLYKRGWTGVNIDPAPGLQEKFELARPADRFFPVAVSNSDSLRNFFLFDEPALNTFDESLVKEYQECGYTLIDSLLIESRQMSSLLDECEFEQPIDLMSIDVEGNELQVLQSNNWDRYHPKVVLVEILGFDLSRAEEFPVHNFMMDLGYILVAKTFNTIFYKDVEND